MKSTFVNLMLPYCLRRLKNGSYVALNRNYMPLGEWGKKVLKDEEFARTFKFARMTALLASKLSFDGNPDIKNIYLYGEGTFRKGKRRNEYFEKLDRIYMYKVESVE